MSKTSFHILRIGLAITFIWIGVLIFRDPESWSGYVQPWAVKLLPVPVSKILLATAIFDIFIGVLFLIDWFCWLAGLLGALHLVAVLAVSGITDITVRDIGILAAAVAVMIESLPIYIRSVLLKNKIHI